MRQKVAMVTLWLWNERFRISKYLVSGFSAFAIDWVIYLICTRGFGLRPIMGQIISVLLAATFAFLANKFWSFSSHENTRRQTRRFAALFIFNYVFQQVGFYVALQVMELHDLIAKVGITAIMVSWNFLLYKYWVYAME